MSLASPIGGYFELELGSGTFPHGDGILLNTARNSLEYILITHEVKSVYIPRYICDVMLEPLKKLGIKYHQYKTNYNLELQENIELKEGEMLVYVNYFGIKDEYCQKLSTKYEDKLILDNSQAFYNAPLNRGHTIYSPRKFFGLPDGGIVYTDKKLTDNLEHDISYKRMSHLLKRIDLGAEAAYEDFNKNDDSLKSQPIKRMSKLTTALLGNIDFEATKKRRIENFAFLNKNLSHKNKLKIDQEATTCPMVYPYLSDQKNLKQRLIDNKIFVATYWPNIFEWCDEQDNEYKLATNLTPLPIDQRYSIEEMKKILDIINGN